MTAAAALVKSPKMPEEPKALNAPWLTSDPKRLTEPENSMTASSALMMAGATSCALASESEPAATKPPLNERVESGAAVSDDESRKGPSTTRDAP